MDFDLKQLTNLWESLFDDIFCIVYLPYKSERIDRLESELSRIGMLQAKNFHFKWTYPNPFQNVLLNKLNKRKGRKLLKSEVNIGLAHYEITKESFLLEKKKILILEDDVCFLKSLDDIVSILKNIPDNYNFIFFDYIFLDKCKKNNSFLKNNKINNYFVNLTNEEFWFASCYAMDLSAMGHIVYWQEKQFNVADMYIHKCKIAPGDNNLRCASIKNLCVQKVFNSSQAFKRINTDSLAFRYRNTSWIDTTQYNTL